MTVYDLSAEQFEELKQCYICEVSEDNPGYFEEHSESEIADSEIYEHYDGVYFVNDDFFCTCGN